MSGEHEERWDALAARYDVLSAGLERRFLAASRPWVGDRARGRVLEVGIGTGANLPYYRWGQVEELVGLERSPAMLDQTRERARELGVPVTLLEGDAGALELPDASVDTVVSTFVLCCVPDERQALREMVRVLRPGGTLLLADHVASDRWWVRAGQAALDAVTVRSAGEHFRRRPLPCVRELNLEVVESVRTTLGALERVHARRPRGAAAPRAVPARRP